MAIPNELTSDIAAALLTHKNRSRRELRELKDVLFTVHSTLQQMSLEERSKVRRDTPPQVEPSKSE